MTLNELPPSILGKIFTFFRHSFVRLELSQVCKDFQNSVRECNFIIPSHTNGLFITRMIDHSNKHDLYMVGTDGKEEFYVKGCEIVKIVKAGDEPIDGDTLQQFYEEEKKLRERYEVTFHSLNVNALAEEEEEDDDDDAEHELRDVNAQSEEEEEEDDDAEHELSDDNEDEEEEEEDDDAEQALHDVNVQAEEEEDDPEHDIEEIYEYTVIIKTSAKQSKPEGIVTWSNDDGKVVVELFGCWFRPSKKSVKLTGKYLTGSITKRTEEEIEITLDPFGYASEFHAENSMLKIFEQAQESPVEEGVTWVDNFISSTLRNSLTNSVNELAKKVPVDYHPNSNNIVRDYVHPGLYCYVSGVSEFIPSKDLTQPPDLTAADEMNDQWGRPYETSKYQWLPTYIDPIAGGNWKFRNEINNLPRKENEQLYDDLENLFGLCVPQFEAAVSYGRALAFSSKHEGEDDEENDGNLLRFMQVEDEEELSERAEVDPSKLEDFIIPRYSLKDKSLQVITKIVDYELAPGQTYEGVWHVEGMSHENIVATADYILERDDNIIGGDLYCKRGFLLVEATHTFWNIAQCRDQETTRIIEEGLVPLGKVSTTCGRVIVFPNSHVHKVSRMTNIGSKPSKRRIVVFFLINPEVRIVSTQECPNQTSVISRDDALQYRLKLMEERKRHKQDWNVRAVSLCEH